MVHQNAFGVPEGEVVSKLAIDLLEDETAQPILSLVAERNNEIIGNIIFSPVSIEEFNGVSAYILAPLAVARDNQGKGIGTQLINHGIETLRNRGVDIVLVYGDPNYYSRTGFKARHNLEAPYKLEYPEAWISGTCQWVTFENARYGAVCVAFEFSRTLVKLLTRPIQRTAKSVTAFCLRKSLATFCRR